jgi:hypothetical protein
MSVGKDASALLSIPKKFPFETKTGALYVLVMLVVPSTMMLKTLFAGSLKPL